ncbi:hypothetical protein FPE01S_05_00435 [Flavihumibacter petaseus NBRC 106054]|uniref:TonB C-terminal domain-containing protein n=1 Tax=Flavihumibacter petaseus NBRC 106054 TaxID=1220578 RepID=A0A0E9N5W1_9BACT|nr:hypothetical protein FPE01S_05_00435 [Flavihumibacter petaseus NBRC 106054]
MTKQHMARLQIDLRKRFREHAFISLAVLVFCSNGLAQVTQQPDACERFFDQNLREYIYKNLSEPPEYPGGPSAWQRFLNKNLKYPQSEIDNGTLHSSTTVVFIVDRNGNIGLPGIKNRSPESWSAYDSACVKTIKNSGRWTPGKCNGKVVASFVEQPFIVCLQDE